MKTFVTGRADRPRTCRGLINCGRPPFASYRVLATFGWTALAWAPHFVLFSIFVWSGSTSYIYWAALSSAGKLMAVLVVNFGVYRTGIAVTDYMALKRPRPRAVVLGITAQAALFVMFRAATIIACLWAGSGRMPRVAILDAAALMNVGLWFWFIAMVPITAISEEIVFRGFMYRGLAKSDTEAFVAVMVTSLVFAMLHLDAGLSLIWHFVCGLLYGLLRWQTGTTWVPIAAHLFNNTVAFTFTSLVSIG